MEIMIERKHKNGHGEGSFRERAGKIQARVLVDGRRLTRTFANRTEARKWIRQTLCDRDRGMLPPDDGKISVASFLAKWLGAVKPSIKPKTYQQYEGIIRLHLIPPLGHLRLSTLRADQLQALYANKLAAGLSPRTVRLIHGIARHALADAVRWGLVPRNVADATTPPKPQPSEMHVWSPEQARAFLVGVSNDRLEALYRLALSCGLRIGELLGLRWEDVDLEDGRLQVRRTIQRLGKGTGLITGEPKTAKGRRQIIMPAPAVEALRRWKVRQLEEQLLAGARWKETGSVFTSRVGTAYEPRKLQDDFAQHATRLGLPRIRLHDLRHTCATLLLTQGVHPKVVQEMLGHSTIAMTLDTYSHVLPTLQADAARVMERVLAGS